MSRYRLATLAAEELESILQNRAEYAGGDAADDLERTLIAAFERLAQFPGLGHRRSDLTRRPVHFYTADPYLIVYERTSNPVSIPAIFHSARDVKKLMRGR